MAFWPSVFRVLREGLATLPGDLGWAFRSVRCRGNGLKSAMELKLGMNEAGAGREVCVLTLGMNEAGVCVCAGAHSPTLKG